MPETKEKKWVYNPLKKDFWTKENMFNKEKFEKSKKEYREKMDGIKQGRAELKEEWQESKDELADRLEEIKEEKQEQKDNVPQVEKQEKQVKGTKFCTLCNQYVKPQKSPFSLIWFILWIPTAGIVYVVYHFFLKSKSCCSICKAKIQHR